MFKALKKLFQPKKLHLKIAEGAGTTTLTAALKGAAGSVHFSNRFDGGVYLWTPNTKEIKAEEAICDLRFSSLSPQIAETFKTATAHLHQPAHCVMFQGTNPLKIQEALEYFDYVLIPSTRLKNDWHCLYKTKILGYQARNIARLREIMSKKVH